MGQPASRVGDQGVGICTAHLIPIPVTITLVEGCFTVIDAGMPTTVRGMMGVCSCGHTCVAIDASMTVIAEGRGKHRIGDQGVPPGGSYTMIQGSPTEPAGG